MNDRELPELNNSRPTIERQNQVFAETEEPSLQKVPRFGTLKGIVTMTSQQFEEVTRPMTDQEVEALYAGRY